MSAYLYAAGAGAVLVLAGLLWWQNGKLTKVSAEFTAYKSAQVQAVVDRMRQDERDTKLLVDYNAKVMADLQGKLDGSVTNGERLAGRLRLALAGVHTSPVPADSGQPGTAPAGGAEVIARAAQLVGDVTAECERNADRLDGWIEETSTQR